MLPKGLNQINPKPFDARLWSCFGPRRATGPGCFGTQNGYGYIVYWGYGDNGKENGNYYIVYGGWIGKGGPTGEISLISRLVCESAF